jgi:hypothetical protein
MSTTFGTSSGYSFGSPTGYSFGAVSTSQSDTTNDTNSSPKNLDKADRQAGKDKVKAWWEKQKETVKNDPSVITKDIEEGINIFGGLFNMVKDLTHKQTDSDIRPDVTPKPNENKDNKPTKILGMDKQTFLIGAGIFGAVGLGVLILVVSKNKNK